MINYNIISEGFIMGIITYVIGIIIFNLSFKNNKTDKKPKGFNLVFFFTGVLLHIIIEIIGLSKFNCPS